MGMSGFESIGEKSMDKIQPHITELFDEDSDKIDSGKSGSGRIRFEHVEPKDIERRSMEIIREELSRRGVKLPETEAPVIERCIHTSADFDYYENLVFSANAVERMRAALSAGAVIVTDTEMAKAGISKVTTAKYDCKLRCFMSDSEVASEAKKRGVTRATVSMEHAARLVKQLPKIKISIQDESERFIAVSSDNSVKAKNKNRSNASLSNIIFAIGNAPTALIELERLIREANLRPAGIIAVPVGFVNVVEAKELIWELRNSEKYSDIPLIVARGRKGGSNIAAAIVNALMYGITD